MAGFTISTSNWVIEDRAELKRKAVVGAISMDLFTIREGIKYSEKLPYITVDPKMQAYTDCAAINPSGDGGTVAQITLTVDSVTYENSWCWRTLESKFTVKYLKKGQKYDENSAPEIMNAINEETAKAEARNMEYAVWQGSKTQCGFDTNLKQFNGFIQTLTTLGGYVNSQTVAGTAIAVATGITTSNVVSIFQNQWLAVPAALRRAEDLVTVCGEDTFNKLVIALTNLNLYHYKTDGSTPSYELVLPGTQMKIKAVPGLNADNHAALPNVFKNRIFTFAKDNFVFATDLVSDLEDFDMWYEKKDDLLYHRAPFKATTGIFFADQVVSFELV